MIKKLIGINITNKLIGTHSFFKGEFNMKMQLALLSLLVALSGAYANDDKPAEEQTTATEDNAKTDGAEFELVEWLKHYHAPIEYKVLFAKLFNSVEKEVVLLII